MVASQPQAVRRIIAPVQGNTIVDQHICGGKTGTVFSDDTGQVLCALSACLQIQGQLLGSAGPTWYLKRQILSKTCPKYYVVCCKALGRVCGPSVQQDDCPWLPGGELQQVI
jgi:hypothetical protein